MTRKELIRKIDALTVECLTSDKLYTAAILSSLAAALCEGQDAIRELSKRTVQFSKDRIAALREAEARMN